jgi:hypothetical protein
LYLQGIKINFNKTTFMKKTIIFATAIALVVGIYSCSKSTVKDCEKNNTGSITIWNDGSFVPAGTYDFYRGNVKIASLAKGQQATVDNIPVGIFSMTVKNGTDTLYVDTYQPDTITQCGTLAYHTSEHYIPVSDSRLKKNIVPISNALGNLNKLNIYSFEYQAPKGYTGFLAHGQHVGFMAQELKEIYPAFVQLNSNGFYSVNYQEMIPLLAKGMQEQQSQIDELKKEVAEMKSLLKQQTTLANR